MLTLLRNAEVFAPAPAGRRDILIAGRCVAALAPRLDDLPESLQARVVDLGGKRTLPGLIDAHVHVTGGGGESGPASRVPPITLSALTEAGITTCVGVLGTDGTTRSVEELVARTLGLREEGLSAYCYTGSYAVPPITLSGSVRRDLAFIDPIIGVGEVAISDHRSSQPTYEEIIRLAADCHVAGLMTGKAGVLHLHVGDGPRGLTLVRRAIAETELPARTFYPTHVNRRRALFDEAKELAGLGATVDVTAFPEADGGLLAEDAIEAWLDAGLPAARLTCSSDGAGCLPVFDGAGNMLRMDVGKPRTLARTLTNLLRRGRALEAVLPLFTQSAADLLRLRHKGRIEVGGDADLLVLDDKGAPLHVMAGGRFMVYDGQPCARGQFEPGATP